MTGWECVFGGVDTVLGQVRSGKTSPPDTLCANKLLSVGYKRLEYTIHVDKLFDVAGPCERVIDCITIPGRKFVQANTYVACVTTGKHKNLFFFVFFSLENKTWKILDSSPSLLYPLDTNAQLFVKRAILKRKKREEGALSYGHT